MKALYVLIISCAIVVAGCTEQQMAKQWGGTSTIDLPANKKLVNVTWKEMDFWYLTRPMRTDEQAETYEFIESSNWGVAEGKVIIKEHK